MNHLGLLSILVCWAGLFFLIWKWKGNGTMTFSQHAAQHRSAIIYYAVMWLLVLPPFYWFLMNPFADRLELGLLFKILATLASFGMLGAAIIPETKGWKVRVHRFFAFLMAYLLCPIVLVVALQSTLSGFARVFLLATGVWMLAGVVRSLIEKRQHGEKTLFFQAFYVMLFHVSILVAFYL